MPTLETALIDLLHETREEDLRLIIGGGYGIYLKREHVRELGVRTLLREWPEARSTNDLDLFLRPELLVDSMRLKPERMKTPTAPVPCFRMARSDGRNRRVYPGDRHVKQ
ncbi:MAG: hypothetical protein GX621_11815 [Pirellulaceae bacterium]|nr:hypothetical protein [Pirellulaceae bacterium]